MTTALIIGGGLAGMAAGLRLSEAGVKVRLMETRPRLGGRATSHVDQTTGEVIDNCQHVVMGCCTNLLDFYERVGVSDQLSWYDRFNFMDKQGHHDRLYPWLFPAPAHLTAAMLGFRSISFKRKLMISKAMKLMMKLGKAGREQLAGVSFGQWLRQVALQDEWLIRHYWDLTIISAINLPCDQCACHYAMQVYQEGFLCHEKSFELGVSDVALVELYDSVADRIEDAGGQVMNGISVTEISHSHGRITGVKTARHGNYKAELLISALPFDRLDRVIPEELKAEDDRLKYLKQIEVSPILGLHLWYQDQLTHLPHIAFMDSPLQWIFNRGYDDHHQAWHYHGVISAASQWMTHSQSDLQRMIESELKDYFPESSANPLLKFRAIKEKRATFSASPGVDRYRPKARGSVDNLYLCGDWTASGWPATMEGAVRSGYLAAGEILDQDLLIPDLEPTWLYRQLSK